MGTKIIFPQIGFSMDRGTLKEWLAADGSEVRQGEPLFLLESEKSTLEIEAPATGRLAIGAEAGEIYEVGAVLGEIQ